MLPQPLQAPTLASEIIDLGACGPEGVLHLPKFLACGGELGGEVPLDLLTDKVVVAAGVERTAAFGVEGLLLRTPRIAP